MLQMPLWTWAVVYSRRDVEFFLFQPQCPDCAFIHRMMVFFRDLRSKKPLYICNHFQVTKLVLDYGHWGHLLKKDISHGELDTRSI